MHNPCLSGGTLEILLEPAVPLPVVAVLRPRPDRDRAGAGRPPLRPAGPRGDDPDAPLPTGTAAVVVASHGSDEEPVLSAALRAGVPYVGLVASRRRGPAVVTRSRWTTRCARRSTPPPAWTSAHAAPGGGPVDPGRDRVRRRANDGRGEAGCPRSLHVVVPALAATRSAACWSRPRRRRRTWRPPRAGCGSAAPGAARRTSTTPPPTRRERWQPPERRRPAPGRRRAARRARRGRLPGRRGHGDRPVLRRAAAPTGADRGRTRCRQDRRRPSRWRRCCRRHWCGCSATRASTWPRRSTSGTTPVSC